MLGAIAALVLITAVFGISIAVVLENQCTYSRSNYDSITRVIFAATHVSTGSPYSSAAAALRDRLIAAQGPRPSC